MIKQSLKLAYKRLTSKMDRRIEASLLLVGKQMAWTVASLPPNADLRQVGFKVFSQNDEDGIIQYLINKIPIESKTFIEFGASNYEESNTRFLLMNNDWQGMVMDSSESNTQYIRNDKIHNQFDLQPRQSWVTRENINSLLDTAGFPKDLGLLSIDIDGNDYWIWEAITLVEPRIVIVEYNSVLGLEPLSIPYKEDFNRTSAHHSNLYFGCSLSALYSLAVKKGYILVGSCHRGVNAFFIRADIAGQFTGVQPPDAYVPSKFRESKDTSGNFTYVSGEDRIKLIEHLPVVNVVTGRMASLGELYRAL